jgi:RNA recognition motif-containing protein
MSIKLYVGNLSYDTTDDSLNAYFASVGTVTSASVARDRETGRSRGFGFVEMASQEDADRAKSELSQTDLDGRTIVVDEARPKTDSPRPRFGGNRGGDRGGYDGGFRQ